MILRRYPFETLLLCGVAMIALFIAAARRFPLPAMYAQTINLDDLTGSRPLAGVVLTTAILALFGAYLVGFQAVRHLPAGRVVAGAVWLLPLGAAAPLLLVYPITSLDLYDYLFRGWMLAHHNANTFTATPIEFFPWDPLADYASWYRGATSYGPIWEALSFLTASIAITGVQEPLQALAPLMAAYKLLALLGYLACCAAVWVAAPAEERLPALYLWAWNPLVLWESIAAGHNDSWMLVWLLLAIALYHPPRVRPRAALLALAAGALVKYTVAVIAPVFVVTGLREAAWLPGTQLRPWAALRFLLTGGLLCVGLAVVTYAPFWAGLETFRQLRDRGELYYAAPLAIVEAAVRVVAPPLSQRFTSTLALSLLALVVLGAVVLAWRRPERPERVALLLILAFFYLANPWFQAWYVLWPLALVSLHPHGRLTRMVVALSLTAALSYTAHSFLRPALGWPGDGLAWQIVLAALIYLPPLAALPRPWWPRPVQSFAATIDNETLIV